MIDTPRRGVPGWLFCTLAVFLAATLTAGCGGPDEKALIDKAKKVDAKFKKAFEKEDVEGVLAVYWNNPEVVLIPIGGSVLRGTDAIRKEFLNFFEGTNVKSFEFTEQNYAVVGDSVVGWGTFKVETDPSLGPTAIIEGRYSEVIAKRDDEWVYIHDHASIAMTPDEGTAAMKAIESAVPTSESTEKKKQ